VLVRAIPSSFASSGCDFDVAVKEIVPYKVLPPVVESVKAVVTPRLALFSL